jgi:hypothetical protein
MDLYGWVVFGHVIAVILSFAAHGVSAFVMFRVRKERDRTRLAAILDLSASSLAAAGILLLVAVALGITAAVMGGHFSRFWPWIAIAVIVVAFGSMTPLAAVPMNKVRRALGMPVAGDRSGTAAITPSTDEELEAALKAIRPEVPAVIGVAAILVLAWLMRAKPF